ncbi:MAG: hypothetical protein HZB61_13670 [Nitrospirae bacterium]|nr:hypothetical protein [Nitrospirota bacterium]
MIILLRSLATLIFPTLLVVGFIGCGGGGGGGSSSNDNPPSQTPISWTTTNIEATGYDGAIAIDSSNNVHIAYEKDDGNILRYATNASGSFVISTIDSSGNGEWDISIAVDSNNKVHVSYYDFFNKDLKYATDASGSWIISVLDGVGDVGRYTSIAIDSNNKVHISYYDVTNGDLKYATNASGSWVTSKINLYSSGFDNTGQYTSIAIDSNNKIHISCYNATFKWLEYYTNTSGSWVENDLDGTGDVGQYSSLVVYSSGSFTPVEVAYYDATNGDLKSMGYSGVLSPYTVDSIGDVGRDTSLAIDSNNNFHISYYDVTNGDLKYAKGTGAYSWVTSIVESTGDVGGWSSIAIDSNNKVHILYHDFTNHFLKYAHSN